MSSKEFDINNLVRPNVRSMSPYASARDEFKEFDRDMIYLDANENPNETGLNRYPDPQQTKVKKLLSDLRNIPDNQILLGNGSDEVLDLIFRAFCEPNRDNVITLPPTYGMYKVLADLNSVEVKSILLSNSFQPNVDAILESFTPKSKLLFLCSPNNPTANSFEKEKIEKLIKNFKGIVIIDEAYIDFSNSESWVSRLDEFKNLIVTQTLSKAYGLAGIRLGICYASVDIIRILNKIKPPYNVNELTQLKSLEILHDVTRVNKEVGSILSERKNLSDQLQEISIIKRVYNSDANFILVKVDDANLRYEQLIERHIVVRNRSNQPLCENCLRFTVGTAEENLRLLKALREIGV